VPRHRNELVRALGFDPDVKRSALIPLGSRNGEVEFAWPQAVVDALVSGTTPGRALQGEYISNRDAAEFATNIVGGGGFLSGMTKPVKGALGANMWHGGPHKWAPEPGFPHGRPRMDKTGTGKGAQAYGHGFYSAEKRGVSQSYQNPEGNFQRLTGQMDPKTEFAFDLMETGRGTTEVMQAMLQKYGDDLPFDDAIKAIDAAKALKAGEGQLYKLDIPDKDLAKYLDWDAPLSQQPKNIQAAIEGLAREYGGGDMDKMFSAAGPLREGVTAESFYRTLAKETGSQAAASEALRKAGIPGLKYYDQMSRSPNKMFINGERITDRLDIIAADYMKIWRGRKSRIGTEIKSDKSVKPSERADVMARLDKFKDASIEWRSDGTRNYVTWDQDVLDRAKILERNNEILANQLKNKGLLMGGNPLAAPLLMPSKTDPLSDPQWAAEFLKSGGA
jgi:hypothetical protein